MKKLLIVLFLLITTSAWAADSELTDLNALGTTPAATDLFYLTDTSSSDDSKKLTYSNLMSGEAATAAALAANPSACTNQFARDLDADGTITCATVVDADVANDITITSTSAGTLDSLTLTTTALTVPNGGTALATITDGAVMLGSGVGAVTPLAVTTDGAIVIGDGTTDPTTLNAFSSSTGDLLHEAGGLEADVNGYDGLVGITGGATFNQTGTTTQIIIFDGAGAPTSAAMSVDATMANDGVVTIADSVAVSSWNLTTPTITTSLTTDGKTISEAEIGRLDGLAGVIVTDTTAVTEIDGTGLTIATATLNCDDAVADDSTKGCATFEADDFDDASGKIDIDYTNGQKATTSTIGFLTDTDWDTFNDKQTAITGTDTHVMFFDGADTPAGEAGMTYAKATDALTLAGQVYASGVQVTTQIQDTSLVNCDTIDTGSAGILRCGTDAGGSATPGGNDEAVQYNNGGSFGGMNNFDWADATDSLTLGATVEVDAGGSTSFEIPNAASPTVDAEGEIAWETDDNMLMIYDGAVAKKYPASGITLQITIDGGGSAIDATTTDPIVCKRIVHDSVITGYHLYAEQAGSVVLDVWKDTFIAGSYPPTNDDSIAGTDKPTLSTASFISVTTLGSMDTDWNQSDVVCIEIESASTIERLWLDFIGYFN